MYTEGIYLVEKNDRAFKDDITHISQNISLNFSLWITI